MIKDNLQRALRISATTGKPHIFKLFKQWTFAGYTPALNSEKYQKLEKYIDKLNQQ